MHSYFGTNIKSTNVYIYGPLKLKAKKKSIDKNNS